MTTDTLKVEAVQTFEIRKEIAIAAPIEVTFEAVLDELGPEEMPDSRSLSVKIEPWRAAAGSDLNNAGHLWGHAGHQAPTLPNPRPDAYALPAVSIQYRESGRRRHRRRFCTAHGADHPEHRDGMLQGNWAQTHSRNREPKPGSASNIESI